jgi:hypothetical protein
VAEKLEAMVVHGNANGRVKDYYDLHALSQAMAFEGPTLVEAIRRTFERRDRHIPTDPLDGLQDTFATQPLNSTRWRSFLTRSQLTDTDPDFLAVVAGRRRFAQPPLDAARDELPFDGHWPPGGPWHPAKPPTGGGAPDA